MLGDLNIAEPKALIGFAGPRVIEQTIRQKLPEGFQRSEFLLEKGMLDLVVDRREMRSVIANALRFMGAKRSEPVAVAAPALAPAGAPAHLAVLAARRAAARVTAFGDRPALLSLRPRTVRHQVRPREHVRDRRPPRPSRADVPIGPHRRHQRQRLGHGDGRRRLARGRPPVGPLHLPSPRRSHRAIRDRRPAGRRATG